MIKKSVSALRVGLSTLISSQFIIAFSALCLSFETILVYGLQIKLLPVFGFIFFGSLGVYNLAYLGSAPFSRKHLTNKKRIFITCLVSFVFSCVFGVFLSFETLAISGVAGFLVCIYLYKLKWNKKVIQARNIPLVKNMILAFIWAVFSVLVPLSSYNHEFSFYGDDVFVFLRRFFFILAIAIPYDIKDYHEDIKNRLQTLPVKFGIGKSKMIALVSLTCFALLVLYNSSFPVRQGATWPQLNAAFYLSSVITALIILLTTTSRKKYYFSIFIDGTMILQFFLVFLNLKMG